MPCPKCGHEQDDADECRHCGIIFEKYRIYQERQAHPSRRDIMPSTGRTLRQEAAVGIETARRYWQQVVSYLREKRFQQHPVYQKLMPFFRFLIGAAYSKEVRLYKRRLFDQFSRMLLLLVLTVLINASLLYLYAALWRLYLTTSVGHKYVCMFSEKAQTITTLLSYNVMDLSLEITQTTFSICMATAVTCQWFHLSRYFYYSRDFWGKLLLWGSVMTIAVAWYLDTIYVFHDFSMACFFALVPTLCLFPGCFDCANDLVPEIGEVIPKISSRLFFGISRLFSWVERYFQRYL